MTVSCPDISSMSWRQPQSRAGEDGKVFGAGHMQQHWELQSSPVSWFSVTSRYQLEGDEEQTARGKTLLCLQLAYNLEQITEPQLVCKMVTPFLCCPIQQSHFMNYLPSNCSSHAYLATFSLTVAPLSQRLEGVLDTVPLFWKTI